MIYLSDIWFGLMCISFWILGIYTCYLYFKRFDLLNDYENLENENYYLRDKVHRLKMILDSINEEENENN